MPLSSTGALPELGEQAEPVDAVPVLDDLIVAHAHDVSATIDRPVRSSARRNDSTGRPYATLRGRRLSREDRVERATDGTAVAVSSSAR